MKRGIKEGSRVVFQRGMEEGWKRAEMGWKIEREEGEMER